MHRVRAAIPNAFLSQVVEDAYEREARAMILIEYMRLATAEARLRTEELRHKETPLPRLCRRFIPQENYLDTVVPEATVEERRQAAEHALRWADAARKPSCD